MDFNTKELDKAYFQLNSLLKKLEKVVPKLREWSSQITLAKNRIQALKIALELMKKKKYLIIQILTKYNKKFLILKILWI